MHRLCAIWNISKKSLHFYKFCAYILRSIFIRAWCELDFAKTETAIEQSLFLQNYKVYTKIGHADEEKSRCIPHINSLPQLTAKSQGFEQYAALLQWSNCSEYVNSHFLLFDNSFYKDVVCNERVVEFEKREIYGAEVHLASKRLHEIFEQYEKFLISDFIKGPAALVALHRKTKQQDEKMKMVMKLTTPERH